MINHTKNTTVSAVEEDKPFAGWTYFQHVDGFECWARTFAGLDGSPITVRLDNWSMTPLSVHRYDLANMELDEEWHNLQAGKVASWRYSTGGLVRYIPLEDVVNLQDQIYALMGTRAGDDPVSDDQPQSQATEVVVPPTLIPVIGKLLGLVAQAFGVESVYLVIPK